MSHGLHLFDCSFKVVVPGTLVAEATSAPCWLLMFGNPVTTCAGGLGLAAIQVATAAGAGVLATAGSTQKRAYLRQQGLATVVSSRSLHFAEHLGCREGTQPSVLLNSLTSPGLSISSSSLVLLTSVDLIYQSHAAYLGPCSGLLFTLHCSHGREFAMDPVPTVHLACTSVSQVYSDLALHNNRWCPAEQAW